MALLRPSTNICSMLNQFKSYVENTYHYSFGCDVIELTEKELSKYTDMAEMGNLTYIDNPSYKIESLFSFERYYGYDFFQINYKGREYILGIFRRHDGRGLSVRIKRYYPNGSTRKKRVVSKIPVKRIPDNNSVDKDCQIRTLAAVTGQPYEVILKEMKARDWTVKTYKVIEKQSVNGELKDVKITMGGTGNMKTMFNGVNRWDAVLGLYGLKKTVVWGKTNSGKVYANSNTDLDNEKGSTVKKAVKILTSGRYVCACAVHRHVCAIIDGNLYDSWNSGNRYVKAIYKIEKI